MNREKWLNGLSSEQIEKARGCHNSKELLELAKQEGIELNDEQLEAISGGACFQEDLTCPLCGSQEVDYEYDIFANKSRGVYRCVCKKCGFDFEK